MAKRSTKMVVGMLPVMFAVTGWMFLTRPWESPIDRAYRLCGECGLPYTDVDRLVAENRASTLTREEAVKLWEGTYADSDVLADPRELCMPCVDAVIRAAELKDE